MCKIQALQDNFFRYKDHPEIADAVLETWIDCQDIESYSTEDIIEALKWALGQVPELDHIVLKHLTLHEQFL